MKARQRQRSHRSLWEQYEKQFYILTACSIFASAFISALVLWRRKTSNVSDQLTYTGPVERIKITSAYVENCRECDLRAHIEDGIIQPTLVYHWCSQTEHDWSEGTAVFNFAWALVTKIEIFTYRDPSIVVDDLKPVVIEICDRKSGCTFCNNIYPRIKTDITTIKCLHGMLLEEDDVEGNQIRIFQERTPVGVCEVKIYGKVYTEVAVRAVEVYSAEADNSHSIEGYKYDIENTLDLIELTSEEDCFVSSKDTEGWAKFLIPWSYVPHIELLTTDSETGDTVEGMSVFVCQMAVDDSCYPCGVIRKTEVASWATVHCTGGMIEGDPVLITHSYRRLQFCDVKIYGLQLDPGKGVVSLVSAVFNDTSLRVERELSGEYVGKHSHEIGGGFPSNVDASLVGRTFSPPRFCPVSDLPSNNWALMHMQYKTIVHRVALLVAFSCS